MEQYLVHYSWCNNIDDKQKNMFPQNLGLHAYRRYKTGIKFV